MGAVNRDTLTAPFIDRNPIGSLEEEIVTEYRNIATVQEIWVRHIRPFVNDGRDPLVRVYLAHSLYVPHMMAVGDRVIVDIQRRNAWRQTDLAVCHLIQGEVQLHPDRPARIWRRQEIVR